MPRLPRTLVAAVVLCAALAGWTARPPAWSSPGAAAHISAAPAATLTDLKNLDQLRGLFNQQAGLPRVILLLSPT